MIIKLMFLVSQAGFIISQPRIIPGELGTLVLTQEIYPEDYLYEYVENEYTDPENLSQEECFEDNNQEDNFDEYQADDDELNALEDESIAPEDISFPSTDNDEMHDPDHLLQHIIDLIFDEQTETDENLQDFFEYMTEENNEPSDDAINSIIDYFLPHDDSTEEIDGSGTEISDFEGSGNEFTSFLTDNVQSNETAENGVQVDETETNIKETGDDCGDMNAACKGTVTLPFRRRKGLYRGQRKRRLNKYKKQMKKLQKGIPKLKQMKSRKYKKGKQMKRSNKSLFQRKNLKKK
ncbi:uncharacterized protein LOC111708206 [Eurytemora carolleeae]|uniref:uncharacterized protein LOC111708206 n=1 Tax=Eurytemora carolleeae TaxID=1294199 RepID=UPI000C775180|nr:uncharacterized protein LOC111708206 [Eurytemora carolleeae]|eukprot:XP_023337278.1 uncharacterized protein LOC111708206 [Eurytemora affinis]